MARLYFSKGLDLFVVQLTTRWQSCLQKKQLSRIKQNKKNKNVDYDWSFGD